MPAELADQTDDFDGDFQQVGGDLSSAIGDVGRLSAAKAMGFAFFGFWSIAALTWFFSSRPRLYLRVFVPRDKWIGVARWAFRDDFRHGMRLMAVLQFGMATVFGLVWLWLCLRPDAEPHRAGFWRASDAISAWRD